MSDTGMSPMSLPSCKLYSSEPSSSSLEYTGTVKQVDMILIKEEEDQASYTPIGINGACVFPQRSPPDYIDAVYQNRSYTFPSQPNMPMYSNANYANNTNRINHGNGIVKRKRIRTAFTTNQLKDLEEQYRINRYLERGTRMFLSRKLNVSERIIKIWFQNRRMKEKKDRAECQIVDSCTLPAQSTSNSHGSYEPPIPTYNILPQALSNSGIINCNDYIYENNRSVNFGDTPVMEEQHVAFTMLPRESPTATAGVPFDRFTNNIPPPYESEITSTVFSDFSQYCDAYSE